MSYLRLTRTASTSYLPFHYRYTSTVSNIKTALNGTEFFFPFIRQLDQLFDSLCWITDWNKKVKKSLRVVEARGWKETMIAVSRRKKSVKSHQIEGWNFLWNPLMIKNSLVKKNKQNNLNVNWASHFGPLEWCHGATNQSKGMIYPDQSKFKCTPGSNCSRL